MLEYLIPIQMVVVLLFLFYLGIGELQRLGYGDIFSGFNMFSDGAKSKVGNLLGDIRLPSKEDIERSGYDKYMPEDKKTELSNFHNIYGIFGKLGHKKTEEYFDKTINKFKRTLKGAIGKHVISVYIDDALEKFKKDYYVEHIKTVEQLNEYFDNNGGTHRAYITGKDTNNNEVIIEYTKDNRIKTEIDKLVVLKSKVGNKNYLINFEIKSGGGYRGDFFIVNKGVLEENIDSGKIEKIKTKKYNLITDALKKRYQAGDEKLNVMLMYLVPEGMSNKKIDSAMVENGINGGIFETPVDYDSLTGKRDELCTEIIEGYNEITEGYQHKLLN